MVPVAAREPPPQPLEGLRVLLVEDLEDLREMIGRLLEGTGAVVMTAAEGTSGIELALTQRFDVILMDLQMPGIDGFEAMRRLRTHDYRRPIVALTAHAMKDERDRCLAGGFDDHLAKPVDRSRLVAALRRYVATPLSAGES